MIKRILNIALLVIFLSCSSSNDDFLEEVEQISNPNNIYTISDFENIGFKTIKTYNIKDLPDAKAAMFGWMKDSLNNPKDYELRFYKNHQNALASKKLIEEVVGENATVTNKDVTWKEGQPDRRVNRRGSGSGTGSAKPKYLYYVIYGNVVILCEGLDENMSKKLCSYIVKNLE